VTQARAAQQAQHEEIQSRMQERTAQLDDAFDADVKLAGAGLLRKPMAATAPADSSQVVSFTPEWVISARRGYAAARDAMARDARNEEIAHAVRMDNLAASDEALDMATQLIVRQWNLGQKLESSMLALQRMLAQPKAPATTK
jgi:hypothetical protein